LGHETLDRTARRRHKLRNLAHSALLLAGMVGLLFVISWLLLGRDLAFWALAGWVLALIWAPRISPQIVMRMYRARPLGPAEFPAGHDLLARLAARAGLPRAPRLYYVPSAALNAFTLGGKADAVVSVTDGLLRTLTLRELAGVLAHEISHIRNNDLWVMSLADSISRLTSFFSFAGVMLLFLGVPMMLPRRCASWSNTRPASGNGFSCRGGGFRTRRCFAPIRAPRNALRACFPSPRRRAARPSRPRTGRPWPPASAR
jgi:heat shock protein HtpX